MKPMVIQIRGTSGSGKSYIAHNLLSKLDGVALTKDGKIQGYRLASPNSGPDIYVTGSYKNECGGVDGIKTMDLACERVRRYAAKGNVVFEGLLGSHIFQRYVDLSQAVGGLVWAFLDTPIELCIKRIEARRQAKGNTKPLNTKNTIGKNTGVHRSAEKALAAGQLVIYLDHTRAAEQVYELLIKGTLGGQPPQAGYRYEEGRRIAMGG